MKQQSKLKTSRIALLILAVIVLWSSYQATQSLDSRTDYSYYWLGLRSSDDDEDAIPLYIENPNQDAFAACLMIMDDSRRLMPGWKETRRAISLTFSSKAKLLSLS